MDRGPLQRLPDVATPVMAADAVATVVLNWKGAEETIACVQSLRQGGAAAGSIYVVDNDSQDGSLEKLSALGEEIVLIASAENLGFAGGVNLGIERALAGGAGWVLLINNDTRVAPDFYEALLQGAAAHPSHALFSPLILYYDRPDRIWALGEKRVGPTLLTRGLLRNRPLPPDLPAFLPVDFLNACCLLIRRDVFETIGLFDTNYFMYGEDVDFCWRAQQAGFKLAALPAARMWHKVSWSTSPTSPQTRYWRIGNQIRFYRTAAGAGQRPLLFLFTAGRSLWLAAQALAAGLTDLGLAGLRAWRDGWFDAAGRRSR